MKGPVGVGLKSGELYESLYVDQFELYPFLPSSQEWVPFPYHHQCLEELKNTGSLELRNQSSRSIRSHVENSIMK